MKTPRLILVLALAGCWLGGIGWRLYDLQVREHESYCERAEQQQQRVVVLDPPRGTIYDARGRELAVSVEVCSVAADPTQVEEPEATATTLAGMLGVDREGLAGALASEQEFVWVKRKLDPAMSEAVRALELPGIFCLPENQRFFPMQSLASQVLGHVGTDNQGLAGLEYLYEEVVAGEPGRRTVVRDARRGTVLYPNMELAATRPGQDLHLTLDAAIQHVVERELAAAIATSGAKKGIAVVMDPQRGAILAMASHPTFDPNRFSEYPPEDRRNRAVMDAFEPGSTFKMVTLAAAFEANVVDPLETLDCGMGSIRLLGRTIRDHRPFGDLTTRQIIAKSSNVGAIRLGLSAGAQRLYETVRAFGFGRPTGVDLPGESSGILRPFERWKPLTPAYVSFGQAISVTALQLTSAFAAIANGGDLLRPYIVDSVGPPGAAPRQREVVGLTISPSSVVQVRSMLESVVIEGTAETAAVPGYRVAGKTGTAQKSVDGRGYAANRYVAGFVGFAPVSRPALVCAVLLDEPWPLYHGGDVAAPVFAAIARQTLLYLGISPDRGLPEHRRENTAPVSPRTLLAFHEPPRPRLPAGRVPDLAGLSARQALRLSAASGLTLELNGHGAVESQAPPPGTALAEAAGRLEVWLSTEAL